MQQPREIFFQRRRACRTHAHQGDAAAGDLLFRLNEVAAIDKQRRLFFADDQRARRAGEAGKPLTRLEMVGNIFRSMAVRRRHDDRGKVLILHPRPKRGDFFRNLHRKSLRLSDVALLYTYNACAGEAPFWGVAPSPGNSHSRRSGSLRFPIFRHAFSRTAGAWLQSPARNLRFLDFPLSGLSLRDKQMLSDGLQTSVS